MTTQKESLPMDGEPTASPLQRILRDLDLTGESPARVSSVKAEDFDWIRILFGLALLYDSWTSLSWSHKLEMSQFLAVSPTSAWVSIVVALTAFIKLALAASLIAGRGLRVMGWVGVLYGVLLWLAVEHGGDFGQDATDPGLGLPYIILFLYVLGTDRLRTQSDISSNELLTLSRVLFGLLWGYDALLKLQPYFLDHYLDYLSAAQQDTAGTWQGAYDHIWIVVSQTAGPQLVAFLVGVAEAAIAVSLIWARGLRIFGPVGIILSLVIWTTAEEFGGPYSMGVPSMMPMRLLGVAVIYMLGLGYVWMLYNPLDMLHILRRSGAQDGHVQQ